MKLVPVPGTKYNWKY